MKITPIIPQPASQQPQSNAAQDAKARAMEKLMGGAPAVDQNNISVEEMKAVAAPTEETITADQTQGETQEVKKPEEDPAVTKYFAQLAKQEKALRAREAAFKQRELELKQREESLKPPQIDQSKYISKDQLKQDALSALAEAGISYEELTNQLLNQPTRDPRLDAEMQALKAEVNALRQANEDSKKNQESQQSQAYQAAVKQIEADAKKLVFTDPNFETIKTTGAVKDVVELITETFNKDGILMSVEEAAQQVEDYLAEHYAEQYTKLSNVNKIKQRLEKSNASKSQAPDVKKPAVSDNKQPQMKTLTNNTSSSRQLTARERALLAFKGELK